VLSAADAQQPLLLAVRRCSLPGNETCATFIVSDKQKHLNTSPSSRPAAVGQARPLELGQQRMTAPRAG